MDNDGDAAAVGSRHLVAATDSWQIVDDEVETAIGLHALASYTTGNRAECVLADSAYSSMFPASNYPVGSERDILAFGRSDPRDQQGERDHEVDHTGWDPHDDPGQPLIGERVQAPRGCRRRIAGVPRRPGEGQQDREEHALHPHREHQQDAQAARDPGRASHTDDDLPEQDGCNQEAGMLQDVEELVVQGGVVGGGGVPEPEDPNREQPHGGRVAQDAEVPMGQPEPSPPAAAGPAQGQWAAAQDGAGGGAEGQQRRRDQEQQQVLDHVGRGERARQGVQGGQQRQAERHQGPGEAPGPPAVDRPPRPAGLAAPEGPGGKQEATEQDRVQVPSAPEIMRRRGLAGVGEDRTQHEGRTKAGRPTNRMVTTDSRESRNPAKARVPPRSRSWRPPARSAASAAAASAAFVRQRRQDHPAQARTAAAAATVTARVTTLGTGGSNSVSPGPSPLQPASTTRYTSRKWTDQMTGPATNMARAKRARRSRETSTANGVPSGAVLDPSPLGTSSGGTSRTLMSGAGPDTGCQSRPPT